MNRKITITYPHNIGIAVAANEAVEVQAALRDVYFNGKPGAFDVEIASCGTTTSVLPGDTAAHIVDRYHRSVPGAMDVAR